MTNAAGPAQPLDGTLPEWVHLLPEGTFSGADGRGPYRADAKALVALFHRQPKPRPLVVDFVHQTFHAAKIGQSAPAAGWIVAMEARPDGVWGRVEWTPAGTRALQSKEYRFISPAFEHGLANMTVNRLTGAGLVNSPNLTSLSPVIHSAVAAAGEEEPATIERLVRAGRDEGSPKLETIMAEFGLPAPETAK